MKTIDLIQMVASFGALIVLGPFLGRWMMKIYSNEEHLLKRVLGKVETALSKGIGPTHYTSEMDWKEYLYALMWFNGFGLLLTFAIQMLQGSLPLNPQGLPATSWHLALNTAISFVTNTNWQSYSGESTLSYFTQMTALTVQNFVSAATGMAVAVAFVRGLISKQSKIIGNFWADLTRGTLYILLPLSILLTVLLMSQGVIQNLSPAVEVTTLEGAKQVLPMGPAASQVAIKQLGTNGGGYFGVNSAHPFENSSPFSNFLQLNSILILAAGFVFLFGRLIRRPKHAWVIFGVMIFLLAAGFGLSYWSELQSNSALGIVGSSLEGKEQRFGIMNSVLWSTFTTAASNGSVNAMHASLSPVAGAIALFNMMLGEIIFGGVGAGLYGMLLFVILTVFLSGLMVGRTPEYLGKKIESYEVRLAILAIILPSAVVLVFSAFALVHPLGLSSLANAGPHGLTEVLYAFTSAANNNGSAFAGLSANTPFYNLSLGFAMLIGRYGVIVPVMAIAGSMAQKKIAHQGSGTFPTETATFSVLLIGVIMIVGGLTYFPVLSLGPVIEHLLMLTGRTF